MWLVITNKLIVLLPRDVKQYFFLTFNYVFGFVLLQLSISKLLQHYLLNTFQN